MKVLVTVSLRNHRVTDSEEAVVLQVIQKREKDCVSKTDVVDVSVNPKYFTQVWEGDLSGGVTEIMLQVISDCYIHYKSSDPIVPWMPTSRTRLCWSGANHGRRKE